MIRRVALLALALFAVSLRAQPTAGLPLEITADRNVFENGEFVLNGNVRLSDGTFLLLADEGKVRDARNARIATVVGHIQFTRGELRLLADRLVYNTTDGTFSAENIRFGSYPYFVEGFSAEGSRQEITIHRAKLSYGEPGPWQPTVIADQVVIAPGQHIRTEKASGGIGHTQPVPFPKFEHSIGESFPLSAQLLGGFDRALGLYIDAALHVPVSPSVRLGADVGIFTERGVMVGPSGRYAKADHPEQLRGYFRSGYINDHGDKKTDRLGRPVPEDRAYIEWQHQQTLAENLTFNAQVNWWKDSEVLRDFRSHAFFPVQEPDTFVESVYTGPNYFVSAFARFQPNRFHRVQERLPEIRFDLLPFAIGNGLYQRFNASVAVLREDLTLVGAPLGSPPPPAVARAEPLVYRNTAGVPIAPRFFGAIRQTTRVDAYYGLERPIAPAEWFVFTPVAGGRLTSYSRTRDTAILSAGAFRTPVEVMGGTYTRLLGEVGADAALRASGVFDYKNPQWKIDGLRHLVTPRLSYRYIPHADKGRERILPTDREVFSTYLPPLGLGDVRSIDDLYATNTLRLAVDNVIQTRDAAQGTRDLLVFNVANDFRFERRPGERRTSEIHVETALMPAHWLQFDLYESFAPRDFTVQELNSGITVRDGRAWSVRFGNNFLYGEPAWARTVRANYGVRRTSEPIQDFSLDGRIRLNEKYEARTRLRYDARKQRFNEQSYGIVQNLGNTWLISYAVSLYSGRSRESSFGLRIDIDTVRF